MRGGDGAELCAIMRADVPAVARFLNEQLNSRVSADSWERAMTPPWSGDWPDHGLLLRHRGRVVGAQLAFYSTRDLTAGREAFCNLGAWCVLEEYRSSGLRLLRGLLRNREYTFTDFSPSGNVVELNRRLRFAELDTRTHAVLPRPSRDVQVTSEPDRVAALVPDASRRIYEDHRTTAASHHVVARTADEACYLIFRRDRRRRLPLFATVLHVSDGTVFRRYAPAIAAHLLARHRVPVLLAEERIVGGRPAGSAPLRSSRPRMFRSERVAARDVDYLYSELTCVAW